MNKIKSIILDQTNWLEVTIVNENNEVIHCESFGDSNEYITLLNQRCIEFSVELSEDNLSILAEQKGKRKVLTEAEINEINKQNRISEINSLIQEAKAYLSKTSWIWEKYNRNVLALKDLTDAEFQTKYQDIILLQEEARLNINKYEQELILVQESEVI